MKTIIQMTIANIKRKKFRTSLIVLSVILSVALLYTVFSISSSITSVFEQKIKKEVGNTDIMASVKENSTSPYLGTMDFQEISELGYHIPIIQSYGFTEYKKENIPVAFTGMELEDYKTIFPLKYLEKTQDEFNGNRIMVGKETAEKYHLEVDDTLKITVAGVVNEFQIIAIVEDHNNNLGYEPGSMKIFITREGLAKILNLRNQVSAYYIQTDKDTDTVIKNLKKEYPEIAFKNLTDISDYQQMIAMIQLCLMIMVCALIMVSTFIINSSFKVISIERMPLIGTLRSIGSTRKITNGILLFEAVFYGVMGCILGNVLGIILLSTTLKMMFSSFGITMENISYLNINYMIISSIMGMILVIGSSYLPIIKMGKMSIKSIIFSEIQNEKHLSRIKTIVGAIFIIIAFILFKVAPVSLAVPLDCIGMLFVTIGGAFMIPIISRLLVKILSIVFRPIFKDAFEVTTQNIKNDKTIMNNIILLGMGLGVILMINNFSSTVSSAVGDLYAKGKADAVAFCPLSQEFLQQVENVKGVDHVYGVKEMVNVSVNKGKIKIPYLEGIDGKNYSKYAWDEFGEKLTDDLMKDFKNDRTIIMSKFIADKYGVEKGDIISIEFEEGAKDYRVIEIVSTLMNNGQMCFIHETFLKKDAGIENYSSMYVNINNETKISKVLQEIKELEPNTILPIITVKEMQETNIKSNNVIFFMMKAISVIAMFIGVVGILNNFIISFLSRRKLFATMRSLGLSKSKTMRIMLLEAFVCGCVGTLSGLLMGTLLLNAMTYLLEALGIPSDMMFYNMTDYAFVLIAGIVLAILSAILPAVNISKENIVVGLRYE